MKVPYDKMLCLLSVEYRPNYTSVFEQDLTFTFEEYVKSQLHLNVMAALHGRDLFTYSRALKYLRGETEYLVECNMVLKYFYQDMANMICGLLKASPGTKARITIESDLVFSDRFSVKRIKLSQVVDELKKSIETGQAVGTFSVGILARFRYGELDKIVPNDLLATASIFSYYGNDSQEPCLVEVI